MTLGDVIEQVYSAFADMSKPTSLKHEPWELRPDEEKALTGLPLRQLPPELMRSYLFDAVYHVGTWDDFRYFLPRLLELLTLWEIEWESLCWRLDYGQEQQYPLSEQQHVALHDFFIAYWNDQFGDYGLWLLMDLRFGDHYKAFGATRAELLHLWQTHPDGAAYLALEICMTRKVDYPGEWERDEVMAWLEKDLAQTTDANVRENLEMALDLMRDPNSHSRLRPDTAQVIAELPTDQALVWVDDILGSIRNPEWPEAQILLPFLAGLGPSLTPSIREALNGDDEDLQITLLQQVVAKSPELAGELLSDLQRLAARGDHQRSAELAQGLLAEIRRA